jgi:DNA invertase Pin-like site-specific DNA recombinase
MTLIDYKQRVLDYTQGLINESLIRKGKKPVDEEPIYIGYLRKSTDDREKQQTSIEAQESKCRVYEVNNELTVYDYVEEKKSAFVSGKRPVFSEIISHIKSDGKRKYNSILAFTPDRLSRNMKEAGEIIDLLDAKVMTDLKFGAFHFENDYNGLMNLGIHFVMAKQYSDNLSVHTLKGNKAKAFEGKGLRFPGHGYRFESKKERYFRPDGNNFCLLQKAFRMGVDGYPMDEIADFLNENRYKYLGKIKKMRKQEISDIFKNPFYAGVYIVDDIKVVMMDVDPLFKPMITFEEFYSLRRRLDQITGFKKKYSDTILFRDLVTCAFCGRTMTPGKPKGKTKRYLRLSCGNKKSCPRHTEDATGRTKKYKREVRSKVIFEFVDGLLGSGIRVDKKLYDVYLKTGQKEVQEQIKELEHRQAVVTRQINEKDRDMGTAISGLEYIESKSARKEVGKQIGKLTDEKKELESELDDVKEQIKELQRTKKQKLMSYDEFLNFFKYVNGIIQNSDNRYVVDKVIRMIFLNFSLDSEKVVSYQLNPIFEDYIKVASVSSGVEEGT